MVAEWQAAESDAAWLTYSANYLFHTAGVHWSLDPLSLFSRLSLPNLMNFTKDLAAAVADKLPSVTRYIALVDEAQVAKTRAERKGDRYIVNGSKMFITSGMRADWLTCAVRTGGAGAGGHRSILGTASRARVRA